MIRGRKKYPEHFARRYSISHPTDTPGASRDISLGSRTWERRHSDLDTNVVFKINYVVEAP